MRWFLPLVMLVGGGCDQVFGLEGRLPPDAMIDAAIDAADEFGAIALVTLQCPAGYTAADLTLDRAETKFAYTCGTATASDLFEAPVVDAVTGGPQTPVVATAATEASPELSPDGLLMYFLTFEAADTGRIELMTSTSGTWTASPLPMGLNRASADDRPGSPDELNANIVISRAGVLVELQRVGPTWTEIPTTLQLTNMAGAINAHLSADGLTLVFSGGATAKELYVARRTAIGTEWPSAIPIAEVNNPDDEVNPWLSADGRRLYFTRRGSVFLARK